MAEMEKEGRPPENKRSRKPAHPVKREINEEMKNFAENTMNELLGWYGYDKVELKDGEDIEFRSYTTDGESRQHISVLKENSLPKPKLPEDSVISSYNISTGYSGLATGNGLSDSPAGSKDHGNVPIIVPLIPPPFIKPPAEDDVSNVQIMCAWCQKVGIKRYSLSMGSEVKSFCSEKCFAACRRAYFKRNKARDEDGRAETFPQQHYAKETPRLAFKNNCELLEHSLPGYIAWREGVEQTMSCHPVTPAGQLTTSLWLKLKQITQLPVIKHLGGSGSPWWPQGRRSQQVLDPSSPGPPFLPTSSRVSPEELRDFAGLKTTTNSKTKHQPATRTNVGILAPSSRLYG